MAHILIITHWFPTIDHPVSGVFVREHVRAISMFHEVTVIHLQGNVTTNPGVFYENDRGLSIYRVRYQNPPIPKTGVFSQWVAVRRILSMLITHHRKPDIVHACVYTSSDIAFLINRYYQIPAILTEHTSAYARNLIPWYKASVYRFYLNRMKLIMPISKELLTQMTDFGVKAPYEIIPNAVDTTIFFPDPDQKMVTMKPLRIITVAMLYPIKGLDFLLKVFSRINLSEQCELTIIGDGPERDSLQEFAKELKIDANVYFSGMKNKQEIAELLRESHLFVLTSRYETQGVVLIEAMASGLPIVAPSVGGIPEIVKPFCGALFTPDNISEAVEKLEYVLTHPNQYPSDKISNYAMSEYSLDTIGKKFSDAYLKVLE